MVDARFIDVNRINDLLLVYWHNMTHSILCCITGKGATASYFSDIQPNEKYSYFILAVKIGTTKVLCRNLLPSGSFDL